MARRGGMEVRRYGDPWPKCVEFTGDVRGTEMICFWVIGDTKRRAYVALH